MVRKTPPVEPPSPPPPPIDWTWIAAAWLPLVEIWPELVTLAVLPVEDPPPEPPIVTSPPLSPPDPPPPPMDWANIPRP